MQLQVTIMGWRGGGEGGKGIVNEGRHRGGRG